MAGSGGGECSGCGRPLSRYNSGPCCQACISAGRKSYPGPPGKGGETLVDGGRLAQLRRDHGWTQELLAGRAGLSAELVKKLEQGVKRSTRLSSLAALARALDVPVGVLLGDSPAGEPAAGPAQQADGAREPEQAGEPSRPTLLRSLITERHWQKFRAFQAQFRRAARDLAERDGDPDLAKLTVSSRQWERWYSGNVKTEPHPDACRVLEHMFGYPVQQLLAAPETGSLHPGEHDARSDGYGLVPGQRHHAAISLRDTFPALEALNVSDLPSLGFEDDQETGDAVRRRTFVGLTSTSLLGALLDVTSGNRSADAGSLASVLAGHATDAGPEQPGSYDIAALAAAVNHARRHYQACRYSELIGYLPRLLVRLDAVCVCLDGQARSRAFALSADAYHVAAGLLLKLDDQGLAYLAADRSMRAAQASEDPVTIGASARIVTHTLTSGGHRATAVSTVSSYAARLNRDVSPPTPESLSVYGSLLLRGAIAAAQDDQRATAHELLGEADGAAQRLGADGNLRWTAFGPTNAKLHRVNIAVTLGDAGTAVDVARGIDLSTITVTERKASLLVDTARAFLQWGRHEKAYIALCAAEEVAHEEIAGRPSVHRLVRELVTSAPPTLRREATRFASRIGVSR
jgi:transcriptional regulator with XRE-family HTH domain